MKEQPILFSGPMVRALLAGTKTQTRRIMKPQPDPIPADVQRTSPYDDSGYWWSCRQVQSRVALFDAPCLCPYGYKRERLWVKETHIVEQPGCEIPVTYRADYSEEILGKGWTPSIFMRRIHSRITLEIVNVRVERLNDISEADARAEGGPDILGFEAEPGKILGHATYRDWYRDLWEQINGAGSWATNPWVWVLEFRRIP